MTRLALLFSSGIIAVAYFPFLPPTYFVFIALGLIALAYFCFPNARLPIIWLFALCLGIGYGIFSGHRFLDNQLSESLAGKDLWVEGQVIGLPQEDDRRQLFTLKVTRAFSLQETDIDQFPATINLSSYDRLRVKTGEHWRLQVKLKVPRGFVNPGGFDYQASLLRRGIGATGYIRPSPANQLLKSQPLFSIDLLRYELQQWLITASHSSEKGILVALLVGDTSLVDKDHWGEMIKTGTNHLIAISGLHLGFFAIVGFFLGNFLGRFIQLRWHRVPSLSIGYFFAVFFTIFYSLIAGMNIPTLRTLIMLGVVQWVYLWRRSFRGRDTLLLALILVLLYDPLATYDVGFWLSFVAVGMLIFCFSGRIASGKPRNFLQGYFLEFIRSQWIMFVGLLVPLAVLVHSSSLLAPLANFVAIPVITFFVVPCLILAALSHLVIGGAEYFFLTAAEKGLALVHEWLSYLLDVGAGQFNPLINFNTAAVVLASLSVAVVLMPSGLINKKIGLAGLLLALVVPLKKLPELQMFTFDVGQGTALLIRTPNHQLLYDTGPVYTENFDAGSGIIVPYLQGQGLRKLDALVVSHNDQDHSGGLQGVLAATEVKNLWLGEPDKYHPKSADPRPENCHSIPPWHWDEVDFRFITWAVAPAAKANNHSCVLLVQYWGQSILLTGDIEKEVEQTLLAEESLPRIDVLLAPHHGSHTSSTENFVAQTHPRWVIYSAGYHNQHGHPHRDVVARYQAVGAVGLNTAYDGAVDFLWDGAGVAEVRRYRQSNQRYWFAQEGPDSTDPIDKN